MSVDQRFRAERLRRQIAEMEAASAIKPQPEPIKPSSPRSCWDDPAFTDRVLARAARHETILAQVRSGDWMTQSLTPKQQWDKAVEKIMEDETDGDRPAALKIARKRYRGILNQMRIAANR
jgi:hypothetical protein